jgi:hypothetical protein
MVNGLDFFIALVGPEVFAKSLLNILVTSTAILRNAQHYLDSHLTRPCKLLPACDLHIKGLEECTNLVLRAGVLLLQDIFERHLRLAWK